MNAQADELRRLRTRLDDLRFAAECAERLADAQAVDRDSPFAHRRREAERLRKRATRKRAVLRKALCEQLPTFAEIDRAAQLQGPRRVDRSARTARLRRIQRLLAVLEDSEIARAVRERRAYVEMRLATRPRLR